MSPKMVKNGPRHVLYIYVYVVIVFVFSNLRPWSSNINDLDLESGFDVKIPPRTGSKGLETEFQFSKSRILFVAENI